MDSNASHIILFDGVCNLCNGFVRFIIKRDPKGKFKFGSLQGKPAKELLENENRASDRMDSVVFISNGLIRQKSTAVLHILREMGGLWKLLYALIIVPKFIRDEVYDFVAANRYKLFGKREECMIPTAELQDRFLDK